MTDRPDRQAFELDLIHLMDDHGIPVDYAEIAMFALDHRVQWDSPLDDPEWRPNE